VVLKYSPFKLAVLFIPMAACMIISSSLAGKWVAVQGAQAPVTLGCFAAGAGVILTNVALGGEGHFVALILTLALAGVGFGVAVVPITSVALSALPSRHSGMAASATTTTRQVGTVLGVAVLGSLFNNRLTNSLAEHLTGLEVPPEMHGDIQKAVLTGEIPPLLPEIYTPVIQNPTQEQVEVFFQVDVPQALPDATVEQLDSMRTIAEGIVNATRAALDAVGNGVAISLWVAGGIIIASGIVAYFTFPRTS